MKFGKPKKSEAEQLTLTGILNSQDSDVLVVRGKDCTVLYLNDSARTHTGAAVGQSSKTGYCANFPLLCDHCPLYDSEYKNELPATFEVQDKDQHFFSARFNNITWLDGKPATVIFLRDIDEEKNNHQKLYDLAYTDQLTGVPNRRRFKEDFEAKAAEISADRLRGIVAIFDLDNFKNINDTYGHNTGDVMLRRITEHILGMPAFTRHLYRLGGDEFVLFFADPAGQHPSDEEIKLHFSKLLQSAFMAYTMPNIEDTCTISMGVALFPFHGENSSELLRKADIALYLAKSEGRNRLVFFEDQYDTAKKFKDLYINIQPILVSGGRTFGYELVDRGNEGSGVEDELNLSEFDRTIDALGLGDMEGDARYFISFSNQLLNKSVLNNLPKDKFIVQVPLADDISDRQIVKYKQVKAFGYSIALLGIDKKPVPPALLELADYCKFAPGVTDGQWQKQFIAQHAAKRFIATNVDSAEQYEEAKERGFLLYQGYFFNQPVVVKKTKDIHPLKVNYFRLLQLTSAEGYVNFQEISQVISSDVALSYKLLRLLNSASVGLRNQVSSIDMAVAYLGEESLKKWIAMLALRGIASDKPLELVRMSMVRAQFGELLSPHFKPPRNTKHVFLTGLLSLLHIALEKSKEELLDEIPVADEIRVSLLTSTGPYSDILSFFSNYEYANWDEVSRFAKENQLSDKLVNDSYIAAVKWYNELADD